MRRLRNNIEATCSRHSDGCDTVHLLLVNVFEQLQRGCALAFAARLDEPVYAYGRVHNDSFQRRLRFGRGSVVAVQRRRRSPQHKDCIDRPPACLSLAFGLDGVSHQLGDDRALITPAERFVERLFEVLRDAEIDERSCAELSKVSTNRRSARASDSRNMSASCPLYDPACPSIFVLLISGGHIMKAIGKILKSSLICATHRCIGRRQFRRSSVLCQWCGDRNE